MAGSHRLPAISVDRMRVGTDDDVVVRRQRLAVLVVDAREQLRRGGLVGIPVRHVLDQPPTLLLRRGARGDGALPLIASRERRRRDGWNAAAEPEDVIAKPARV